ncbi:MAG: sigma-70 family RNA polymerase sigma factor [Bacteroidota bacterium]
MQNQRTISEALTGDINAFQSLFIEFQDNLKSYLFRLTASRADADDLAHDAFIKAFDNLHTFNQKSSLKTWVFQIATNLAYNELKKRKRWVADVKTQAKELVINSESLRSEIQKVNSVSEFGKFEIREHIDMCFTCMAKNLPIESQIVVILKDVYDFSVKDIMTIIDKSEGQVKYLLQLGRKTLTDIFEKRCALVNKKGVCNQCSELNGWFNPKQNQQEEKMKLQLVKDSEKLGAKELFSLRMKLVKHIDPLRSEGNELQEILLNCNRMAMGEINAK